MTPIERIGELVAAALLGDLNGRALQQAISEHLDIQRYAVQIDFNISTSETEIRIMVPR